MTNPSMIGVTGKYSSVASSALSPCARRTGVVWVWNPVIVFGFPAWPTTSTAWPTLTLTGRGLRFSSKVTNILGCMAVARPYSR